MRGLRRGSAVARLLELRIRIPPETWASLCCEVDSLRRDGRTSRSPTEHGVSEHDREASITRRFWHTGGCRAIKNGKVISDFAAKKWECRLPFGPATFAFKSAAESTNIKIFRAVIFPVVLYRC